MDAGRGLDTMGPNISRSLLFWLVLVLPLLVDAAAGASGIEKKKKSEQTGFTGGKKEASAVRETTPRGLLTILNIWLVREASSISL